MNNFSEIKRPNNFNQTFNAPPEKIKPEINKIEIPKRKKVLGLSGVLGVLGVLGILGVLVVLGIFSKDKFAENKNEWQAIFLSNGEVYFGKIIEQNIYEVVANNIFYLQAKDPLQQGAQVVKQNNDIALIKLGKEIHGPTDEIRFNRDQILFLEDMKDDARIVKAIKDYLKK